MGEATVSLYTDRPAEKIRSTDDVDIFTELAHYKEYAAIEEKLRKKGFVDAESGMVLKGIVVDIMAMKQY